MNDTVVVALIGLIGSGVGSFIGILANSQLIKHRIGELEKKVEKHNNVIERTYKLEGRMQEAEHDIIDLKGRGK